MHFVSDRSLMRNGYAYSEVPGGWVGYPVDVGRPEPLPKWSLWTDLRRFWRSLMKDERP